MLASMLSFFLFTPSIQLKLRSHIIDTDGALSASCAARLTNGVKTLIMKSGCVMNVVG